MLVSSLIALTLVVTISAHSINVRGVFVCEKNPRLPVFVKLMEKDMFKDDVLQWAQTMAYEDFEIRGTEDELFEIRPYLQIMHNCHGQDEIITVNFGGREGDVEIDLGYVDLDSPRIKEQMLDKFNFN